MRKEQVATMTATTTMTRTSLLKTTDASLTRSRRAFRLRASRRPVQKLFLLSILLLLLVVLSVVYHPCEAFLPPLGVVHKRTGTLEFQGSHPCQDKSKNSNARHSPNLHPRTTIPSSSRRSFRFVLTDEVVPEHDEAGVPTSPPPKVVLGSPGLVDEGGAQVAAGSDPLAGSRLVQLSVWPHAPLGCVVEECLATYDSAAEESTSTSKSHVSPLYVFVSAVKSGGNADKAGLQVGDVLIECTDLFGRLTDATHLGVEKVKGLVKSRPDDEPLVFKVARGSRVLDDHEATLVELCRNPDGGIGANEELMEQCVTAFVQSTYDDFDDAATAVVTVECPVDSGGASSDAEKAESVDCLVDSMYSMWAEDQEFHGSTTSSGRSADEPSTTPVTKNKSVKPWSSRSSPSGTYVRDPATGQLKNIDA